MRRPSGYVGLAHQTLGSDILAIPRALRQWFGAQDARETLLERLLPGETIERLDAIDPTGWYPIEWLLELTDVLDGKIGPAGLRKIGRTIFQMSHEERVLGEAHCGLDIVKGLDAMYHHANRGDRIGGWRVTSIDEHAARLEKTTPHHCALEEGIVAQAMAAVGCRTLVEQDGCFRAGAGACQFMVVWLGGRHRG